jgi:seryl-tRNA(Sec) selenium transferase
MSEKRLNNTIFLMYLVTENYCKKNNLSIEDFLKLDEKYAIIEYVAECPDVFDSLTDSEMVEEVEHYVSQS